MSKHVGCRYFFVVGECANEKYVNLSMYRYMYAYI